MISNHFNNKSIQTEILLKIKMIYTINNKLISNKTDLIVQDKMKSNIKIKFQN